MMEYEGELIMEQLLFYYLVFTVKNFLYDLIVAGCCLNCSMLMNVFLPDSVFPNAMSHTPHVAPYMCKIHAKLIAWLSTGTISTKMSMMCFRIYIASA